MGKFLPWIVAAIVVVVVVGVIRLTSSNSPGSLTPTTVTPATSSPVAATGSVAALTRAKYLAASKQMDVANAAAAHGLSGATGDSVAGVNQALGPYERALQTFVYTVHGLSWPGATLVSTEELTQQIETLVTYSTTVASVDPATLNAWLVRFRSLATSVQTADNIVRRQIGIATTTSYP
ncbi:MAG: hypothetical protein ACLQRH_16955 [Acidimicrobiales bacterium]